MIDDGSREEKTCRAEEKHRTKTTTSNDNTRKTTARILKLNEFDSAGDSGLNYTTQKEIWFCFKVISIWQRPIKSACKTRRKNEKKRIVLAKNEYGTCIYIEKALN